MRISTVARVAWGGALVIAPRALLRAGGRPDAAPAAIAFARVLGARHLVQAAVTTAAPAPLVADYGAIVDAMHATQQLALAIGSPRWRAAALVDAAIAVALGTAALPRRR